MAKGDTLTRMALLSPWRLQRLAREGRTAAERRAARTVLRVGRVMQRHDQRRQTERQEG